VSEHYQDVLNDIRQLSEKNLEQIRTNQEKLTGQRYDPERFQKYITRKEQNLEALKKE